MVGKYQVPVADYGVTATSLTFGIKTGEAVVISEKPTLALIDAATSARTAMAEALLNNAASHIEDRLERIKLSANWISAIYHPGEALRSPKLLSKSPNYALSLELAFLWVETQHRYTLSGQIQRKGHRSDCTSFAGCHGRCTYD